MFLRNFFINFLNFFQVFENTRFWAYFCLELGLSIKIVLSSIKILQDTVKLL